MGQGGARGSREGPRGHQRPPGGLRYFRRHKNEARAMYCLIYICSDFIVDGLIFQKKILNFAQF